METQKNSKRRVINKLWQMRHLSVQDLLVNVSKNSELKFILTSVGIWWLISMSLTIAIVTSVIYYFIRIVNLIFC